MIAHRNQRGAALPETALSLTIMLAVLVGGMRLALVGYEQISGDGAAFYDAHETSFTVTDSSTTAGLNPTTATQEVYPRSTSATITASTPMPAPTVNVYTDYGFDQTTNRHGGASMMQPYQQFSTVTKSNIDSLSPWTGGSVLEVTSTNLDPAYLETAVHADVAGTGYNSAASASGAVDYFTEGENTPPYFGGFNYMAYCPMTDSMTVANAWNSCTNGISFRALGLAEYLDVDNWTRSSPGLTPEDSGSSSGMFWEALYHHETYASISRSLPEDITGTTDGISNQLLAQAVLDWGPSGTFSGAAAQVGLTAPGACTTTPCNADIIKVYSWDAIHPVGSPPTGYVPGDYPLTPGAGYPQQ